MLVLTDRCCKREDEGSFCDHTVQCQADQHEHQGLYPPAESCLVSSLAATGGWWHSCGENLQLPNSASEEQSRVGSTGGRGVLI